MLTRLSRLPQWIREPRTCRWIIVGFSTPSYHLFALLLPTAEDQARFIDHLKVQGINAVFHYLPLHLSDKGREMGWEPGDLPVTESVSTRLVRLPLYFDLTDAQQERIIAAVKAYRSSAQ